MQSMFLTLLCTKRHLPMWFHRSAGKSKKLGMLRLAMYVLNEAAVVGLHFGL